MKRFMVLGLLGSLMAAASAGEVQMPRSVPGDKGRYYLLEMSRKGDIITAVNKRVGVDSVVYTKTETNCKTMLMRVLGDSEESQQKIISRPTKWFELVEGSSKSDLARFVCKR